VQFDNTIAQMREQREALESAIVLYDVTAASEFGEATAQLAALSAALPGPDDLPVPDLSGFNVMLTEAERNMTAVERAAQALGMTLDGLEPVGWTGGFPSPVPGAFMGGVGSMGAGLRGQDPQDVYSFYAGLGLKPDQLNEVQREELERAIQILHGQAEAQQVLNEALSRGSLYAKDMADGLDQMSAILITGVGQGIATIIRGTQQMASSVVSMITAMVQQVIALRASAAASTGAAGLASKLGIMGAAVGAIGGILGAVLSRRNDSQPVHITDVNRRAFEKMKTGPDTVNIQVLNTQGEVVDEIEYNLNRRQRLDGVVRIPKGASLPG
jgi:hypothetical protein